MSEIVGPPSCRRRLSGKREADGATPPPLKAWFSRNLLPIEFPENARRTRRNGKWHCPPNVRLKEMHSSVREPVLQPESGLTDFRTHRRTVGDVWDAQPGKRAFPKRSSYGNCQRDSSWQQYRRLHATGFPIVIECATYSRTFLHCRHGSAADLAPRQLMMKADRCPRSTHARCRRRRSVSLAV